MNGCFRLMALALVMAPLACNAIIGNEPLVISRTSDGGVGVSEDGGIVGEDAEASPDGGCNGAEACERVVFVTSGVLVGTGGFASFETACKNAASNSTHPRVRGRSFVPWISTVSNPAGQRLVKGTAAYVTPGGIKIAGSFVDLTDGELGAGISIDENGQSLLQGDFNVWTGTFPDGGVATNCSEWITGTGDLGGAGATDGGWSTKGTRLDCTKQAHVYCFEK